MYYTGWFKSHTSVTLRYDQQQGVGRVRTCASTCETGWWRIKVDASSGSTWYLSTHPPFHVHKLFAIIFMNCPLGVPGITCNYSNASEGNRLLL